MALPQPPGITRGTTLAPTDHQAITAATLAAMDDARQIAPFSACYPGLTLDDAYRIWLIWARYELCAESAAASLSVYWYARPPCANVLYVAFVLNNVFGSPACFQGHRRLRAGNGSPPKRSAKASAFSGFAKQNTAEALSPRRKKGVSDAANGAAAALNITSLFLRTPTFSAASTTGDAAICA
jgi:hypothetical protein